MDGSIPLNRVQQTITLRGYFDHFENGVASGWVAQEGGPASPVRVHAVIDGQETGQVLANENREDIKAALGHTTGKVGFHYQVPAKYFDGREHRLSFRLTGGLIPGPFSSAVAAWA